MKRMNVLASAVLAMSLVTGGCESSDKHDEKATASKQDSPQREKETMQAMADAKQAVATLGPSKAATTQPAENNVSGTVTFVEMPDNAVRVVAEVKGLKPNSTHGFHIHEKGDLSAPDLSSAGAHYNPTGHKHGGPMSPMKHVGDLGNLTADAQGNAKLEATIDNASLTGENSLVGKSVLVHAAADDLKTDPSGNSGARIAGGVIQMKK